MAMKMANIADIKNNLSYYIKLVQSGEEIEICKRNVPVAKIIPIVKNKKNKTKLGCGKGSVKFLTDDLTEPFLPVEDRNMLK